MGPPAIIAGATVVGAGATAYGAYRGYKDSKAAKRAAQRQRELDQQLAIQRNEFLQQQAAAEQAAANALAHAQGRAAHRLKIAASEAKEIAAANAQLVLAEGVELVRRKEKEHQATQASTRSRLWASGTRANVGSQKVFQEELRSENIQERQWIKEAYARQAQVVREGGELQADQLTAEAIGIGAGAAQTEAAGALAYAQLIFEGQQGLAAAGLGPDLQPLGKSRARRPSTPTAPRDYGRFNTTAPQLPATGGAVGGAGGLSLSGTPTVGGRLSNR